MLRHDLRGKQLALLALKSIELGDFGVTAAFIFSDGSTRYYRNTRTVSAIGHAELNGIRGSERRIARWHRRPQAADKTTIKRPRPALYVSEVLVTLEPCIMCAPALDNFGAPRVFYMSPDFNGGVLEAHGSGAPRTKSLPPAFQKLNDRKAQPRRRVTFTRADCSLELTEFAWRLFEISWMSRTAKMDCGLHCTGAA
jgi:tRNA(Arg) A34 adenosine deaminase TadA